MSSSTAAPSVLVLGSGLCCPPLVAHLAEHQVPLLLASRTLAKAQALKQKLPSDHQQYVTCVQYDIESDADRSQLRSMLQQASIQVTISMLPYIHHVAVAEQAIQCKKHLFTTSYVSPAMAALDSAAREAGILLLNECGLDPGLDHMSARQMIDRVHEAGGRIVGFRSLCGGLPSLSAKPNPLGYKLSWSPRGVLLAARNRATYLDRGQVKSVEGQTLYTMGVGTRVEQWNGEHGIDELEFYPNRDSTPYADILDLRACHSVLRGTYRQSGWAWFMRHLSMLGYTDLEESTYADIVKSVTEAGGKVNMAQVTYALAKKLMSGSRSDAAATPTPVLLPAELDVQAFTAQALGLERDDPAMHKLAWLGSFDRNIEPPSNGSVRCSLDLMSARFEELMQYEAGEVDRIVMKHTFEIEFPEKEHVAPSSSSSSSSASASFVPACRRREVWTSSFVADGAILPDGSHRSAMSWTVALPVAIATRALLDGRLPTTLRGVVRPIMPELYQLILGEMEKYGVRFTEKRQPTTVWMRQETKKGEKRAPITPQAVQKLLEHRVPSNAGLLFGGDKTKSDSSLMPAFRVFVERNPHRAIPDSAYVEAGATLVDGGSWQRDAPTEALILGLKELPDPTSESDTLFNRHIYFAHAYKHQAGWSEVLKRFTQKVVKKTEEDRVATIKAGGNNSDDALDQLSNRAATATAGASTATVARGLLYDLEFLTDARGVRVCAFGRQAGLVGAALALLHYASQHGARKLEAPLQSWPSLEEMVGACRTALGSLPAERRNPSIIVLGALGRCGRGAVHVCEAAGVDVQSIGKWDLEETKAGGPFEDLAKVDIVINAIYLPAGVRIPPFITAESLAAAGVERKLSVLVDVSCDTSNPHNPMPLAHTPTTFFDPITQPKLPEGCAPLDVISIDHLPALLPKESSEEFSDQLLPHLFALAHGGLDQHASAAVWKKAAALFDKHLNEALTQ